MREKSTLKVLCSFLMVLIAGFTPFLANNTVLSVCRTTK